jgi:hypothetical protein
VKTLVHKKFNPLLSPYQLIYTDEETGLTSRTFDDLPELAEYVGRLGLTRYDYAVIHGELLKSPPDIVEREPLEADPYCGSGSMIRTAPPEEIQDLLERRQAS